MAAPDDGGQFQCQFLFWLPVHGLHLSPEQIADITKLVKTGDRAAFEEDMRKDRMGFTATWNGKEWYDLAWRAPEPGRDASIATKLPCIVKHLFGLEYLPCTGVTPDKSAAQD